jgi:hypothetical protein
LRNNATELVDELARGASKREGLARELDGTRAMLMDQQREQDGLMADGSLLSNLFFILKAGTSMVQHLRMHVHCHFQFLHSTHTFFTADHQKLIYLFRKRPLLHGWCLPYNMPPSVVEGK